MRTNTISNAYRDCLKIKILDTSLPLFKKLGVKAVKMDDIASILTISKRTLYEIYDNKEQLLFECIKREKETFDAKIEEYAKTAENEMDVVAYSLKLHIKNYASTNSLFYAELHKYKKIVNYLKERKAHNYAELCLFLDNGRKNGFFREDINYEVLVCMQGAFINHVMETKLYRRFSLADIYRTFIIVNLRGCCTDKGLKYLEHFMNTD